MKGAKRPSFSPLAFWDVNFETIDFEKHSQFVIEKIVNYGTWEDFVEMLRFYGIHRFKEEILKAAYLKKEALNFVCVIFDLSPTDFTCYTRRQSQNLPWTY
ncbi:DUF6922 domain-containing protein [Larkinella soli]|uniref:DUF6922 domain-containing protein n=1 Tax=Larkinella soli TaxID=1770527 RepID=UPI000FFBCA27